MKRGAAVAALAAVLAVGWAIPAARAEIWHSTTVPEESRESRADAARMLPSTLSLPGPVDPRIYRVGPGDRLQLAMWGKVSRDDVLVVGPEGTLLLPGAGVVEISGLTLEEARQRVLERVRREVRDVRVDLRLLTPRRFVVHRTGEVKEGGAIEVTGTSRVSDVLPAANLSERASRRRVEVMSRDGKRTVADLDLFYRTGDPALNPFLNDGDIVNVPVASEFVYAAGAVARPGRYELGPRDSLRTLLRIAGDPLPAASEERALLIRWTEPFRSDSLWMSLSDVYSGRVNPPLRDGERLYLFFVPQYHEQREAEILGEIARPGAYPIMEGRTRLTDLVKSAGGFLPTADLGALRVRRKGSTRDQADPEMDRLLRLSRDELTASEYEKLRAGLASGREEYRVDWSRLTADSESLDLLLRDGDQVRVERLVSSIRLDGEVLRPSILHYRPGLQLEDYVREAGGYTDRAWRGKVRVTRAVTGQTLYAKDLSSLGPGDFLWVPEKPDRNWSQAGLGLLTVLGSLSTVVLAIVTISRNN